MPGRPEPDGGYPKYRLPRIGGSADALGPLLVECWGARWPDPIPPARIPHAQQCQVTFDAPRAGVRVTYRFPREVYDEPDWQALGLRVREWIAARAAGGTPRWRAPPICPKTALARRCPSVPPRAAAGAPR